MILFFSPSREVTYAPSGRFRTAGLTPSFGLQVHEWPSWNPNSLSLGKSQGVLLCRSSFLVSGTQGSVGEHGVTLQQDGTLHFAQSTISSSPRTPCSVVCTNDTPPEHPFSFPGSSLCPSPPLSQQPAVTYGCFHSFAHRAFLQSCEFLVG